MQIHCGDDTYTEGTQHELTHDSHGWPLMMKIAVPTTAKNINRITAKAPRKPPVIIVTLLSALSIYWVCTILN